jgi:hypothetical protein
MALLPFFADSIPPKRTHTLHSLMNSGSSLQLFDGKILRYKITYWKECKHYYSLEKVFLWEEKIYFSFIIFTSFLSFPNTFKYKKVLVCLITKNRMGWQNIL